MENKHEYINIIKIHSIGIRPQLLKVLLAYMVKTSELFVIQFRFFTMVNWEWKLASEKLEIPTQEIRNSVQNFKNQGYYQKTRFVLDNAFFAPFT